MAEMLTLLTGGLVVTFNFREELPDDMFDIVLQALHSGAIIVCSMEVCTCIVLVFCNLPERRKSF